MTEQKIAAVAGAVFQMRLLDGSDDQAGWIEVSETEFHTPLHDPENWEKRVLVETAYAPPPALDLACLNEARQCLFVLEQIGSLDHGDIDSDSIDLRFELDGVDTGADVSVSEYAARSSAVISRLLTIITNSKSDTVTSDGVTRRVQHTDDICFDAFALACKAKLAKARAKGRGGWESRTDCSDELLADLLVAHLPKGNAGTFEDIAAFAMMLHQRGADPRVLAERLNDGVPVGVIRENPDDIGLIADFDVMPPVGTKLYAVAPASVLPPVVDERAAFNVWNNDTDLPLAGVSVKNAAWMAWQVRAALGKKVDKVVKLLPMRVKDNAVSPYDGQHFFDDGYNRAKQEDFDALSAADVKFEMLPLSTSTD